MNNIDKFTREMSEAIDLRDHKISVVWVPAQKPESVKPPANCAPVYTSSKDRSLTDKITSMIAEARHTVAISSFLLADSAIEDAIDAAASRRVRVYLMLACETRLENDNPDDEFGNKCLEQHIALLKRLAGKTLVRSASHYHAKVVLIDALGSEPANSSGLLLTANLTIEALERNEELAVKLLPAEIEALVPILKWAIFEYAEHQMLDNIDFKPVKALGQVAYPSNNLTSILSTNSEEQSIKAYALELINNAQEELIVSSFGWQENHEVVQAICNKAKQGVAVKILARIRPRVMPALMKLRQAGAEVFGFSWLHAKAICSDSHKAMVMSANLEGHGLDKGFEIGVKISDGRALSLRRALMQFLTRPHSSLELDMRLGELLGSVKEWQSSPQNLIDKEILSTIDVDLQTVEAHCASDLDQKASIPENPDLESHEIVYKWIVKPRQLPNQASELFLEEKEVIEEKNKKGKMVKKEKIIKQPYKPKTFKLKGEILIAISDPTELPEAIKLKGTKFPEANIVVLG